MFFRLRTDPFKYNYTNRQNPSIPQHCCKFWTNCENMISFEILNVLYLCNRVWGRKRMTELINEIINHATVCRASPLLGSAKKSLGFPLRAACFSPTIRLYDIIPLEPFRIKFVTEKGRVSCLRYILWQKVMIPSANFSVLITALSREIICG